MKKIITMASTLLMAASISLSASTPGNGKLSFNPQPSDNRPFGISVGLVMKQMNLNGEHYPWMIIDQLSDKNRDKKSSPSLQIGFSWSPEFKYGIGLQTGIFYELSADSYKTSESILGIEASSKIGLTEHNLSVPLRVQYRYEIIPDLSVFIYTGPSFDFSMAYNASMQLNSSDADMNYSEKINMYEESDMNRFNLMWGVGAGVRWKFLQLKVGGDWGLTSLVKDEIDNVNTTLNKPFHVSLSFQF